MRQAPPPLDWNALRDLRDRFLSAEPISQPYWISREQLDAYDATLGERIGWKWDAVLAELAARGWKPPSDTLCDFGCGSGIAARRVLGFWPDHFRAVTLWDTSSIAMAYAREMIQREFPGVRITLAPSAPQVSGVGLVSHVLTELGPEDRDRILEPLRSARALLWVEPGTKEASQRLVAVRETLRDRFVPVAPCTHTTTCPMLQPENAAHWCHHFAPAPRGTHQDPFWGHFRRELNLDIGPVAYSFLVLDRQPRLDEGLAHLIGHPLRSPKFLRVLSCDASGLHDRVCSRRSGAIYRPLKNAVSPALYRFELRKNRIVGGSWIPNGDPGAEDDGPDDPAVAD
jgi:hypothetical protein